jgi:heme/copper-type cytochrome/quinol oxidase subunit 2
VLATTTTQNHPYGLQLLTLGLAMLPIILLVVLIVATIVWTRFRHRKSQHRDLMNRLLNK